MGSEPGDDGGRLDSARRALAAGAVARALQLLDEHRRLAPGDAEALALTGRARQAAGAPAAAVGACRGAVALAPDRGTFYAGLAGALRRAGATGPAEAALRRAAAIEPERAEFRVNLANLLRAAGRPAAAAATLRRALALRPDLAEAHAALALVGEPPVPALRRAIRVRADLIEPHVNLAAIYATARRGAEALAAAEAGLRVAPAHPALLRDRGAALVLLGRAGDARLALAASLALAPADPVCWRWMADAAPADAPDDAGREAALRRAWRLAPDGREAGDALLGLLTRQWRWAEAERVLRRLLADSPSDATLFERAAIMRNSRAAHAAAGRAARRAAMLDPASANAITALMAAYLGLSRTERADMLGRRLVALRPDDPVAGINAAATTVERRLWPEVERRMRRVLRLAPDNAMACYSLAMALKNQGRLDEALATYDEGVRLLPDSPRERFNRALALLSAGQAESGLREYEWRWRMPDFPSARQLWPRPSFPQPAWAGEPLAGRRILVWGEQGIGDELWDAGFVPPLVERADACVVECEHRLVPLLQRSFPAAVVVERTQPPDARTAGADLQCPMGSVALRLGATRARAGYLVADAGCRDRLRRAHRHGDRPLIGISWRSRKPKTHQSFAAGLRHWAPVLTLPGCDFLSLQYGDVAEDLAWIRRHLGVAVQVSPDIDALRDLDGFAAQVAACDVVVSIANSTVAMAHALGRPALAVIRHDQDDWRYAHGRGRSPWLPTVRAFWQPSPGDWKGALTHLTQALSEMLANPERTGKHTTCNDRSRP